MNWFRMLSRRNNRTMTWSILGIAVGATAWSVLRRRNRERQSPLVSAVRDWLR